jgi:hypothetical protein
MDRKTVSLIKVKGKAEEAKFDAVGLCVARLIDDYGAKGDAVKAMMADLMSDPRRLGGVTLTLLEVVHTMAKAGPGGYERFVDYLVKSIPEEV